MKLLEHVPSALALAVLLAACDPAVVAEDAGPIDDASTDAPSDVPADAGPVACTDQLTERAPLLLAPDFRRTQIHPAATFDGEHLWVTLTVAAEEGSSFDVVILPLGCDGTPGEPIPVDDDVTSNDIDGALAIRGETLLVAWQRDTGDGAVSIWARAFDLTGTPLGPSAALVTRREGEVVVGTHWFPEVIATEDGFLLVASRGVEAVSSFQIFTQRFDASGAPIGEAEEPALDATRTASHPSVALDDEGSPYLGFDTTPDVGVDHAVFFPPGGPARDLGNPDIGSATPSLAWVGDRVLAAFDVASAARGVSVFDPAADTDTEVAPGGSGAFLAQAGVLWLSDFRGFSANVLAARGIASTLALGPIVTIPTSGPIPGPYRPGLHTLSGDLHLVIYSEGVSPIFAARAAFVRLPRP